VHKPALKLKIIEIKFLAKGDGHRKEKKKPKKNK